MEPNPYESPRPEPQDNSPPEETPLSLYRDAKRNTGLGIVMLLTPLAVGIAAFSCCSVEIWMDVPPFVLSHVGPCLALIGMLILAANTQRRWAANPQSVSRFRNACFSIPFWVAGGLLAGYLLAPLVYAALVNGRLPPGTAWLLPVVLFTPAAVILLVTLVVAWRKR